MKYGNSEQNIQNFNTDYLLFNKTDKKDTVVISTHGIIKKTDKVPKKEIYKAEKIRKEYFKNKSLELRKQREK